ncbi:MAG: response regulator, partial [Campylobacterales bacterium]|nr:response regulator [Campylobacterales bacterium]
ATKKIREFDRKSMIIAVTALDDKESKNQMIRYGAEDYIVKPIDSSIFLKRVQTYFELCDLRKQGHTVHESKNLFSSNIFPKIETYIIHDKSSLAYFWESVLTDDKKSSDDLNEIVRLIYAFSSYLLKNNQSQEIYIEQNEENIYITQTVTDFIKSSAIKNIILKHNPNARYILQNNKLSFMLKKVVSAKPKEIVIDENLDEETKKCLRMNHKDKITAEDFIEKTPLDLIDKIENLEHKEDIIDKAISIFEKEATVENLKVISLKLREYNEVIYTLNEFDHLSFAINSLCEFLDDLTEDKLTENNLKKLTFLISSILNDLSSWRKTIFITQETQDIHYLDSSLLSSCLQIEMIFKEESANDEDEIELF